MTALFVWVKGIRAAAPEKWPSEPIDAVTRGKTVLARHPITGGEFTLTLAQLAKLYPAPEVPREPAP